MWSKGDRLTSQHQGNESVPETSAYSLFNHLTCLLARENVIEFSYHNVLVYITRGFTLRGYSVFVRETLMAVCFEKILVLIFFQNLKSGM
jgi:hypothetical protein